MTANICDIIICFIVPVNLIIFNMKIFTIALDVTGGKIILYYNRQPNVKNPDERDRVNGTGGKGISSFPTLFVPQCNNKYLLWLIG